MICRTGKRISPAFRQDNDTSRNIKNLHVRYIAIA